MKILLINNCHFKRGGADIAYFNTGELLKQKGHQVFYFSTLSEKNTKDKYDKYFLPQTDIRNNSTTKKISAVPSFIYNRKASILLEKYIEEIKPDIAHIHLFMGGLTSSILSVLKKNRIPIIHTVHDYRLICPSYLMLNGKNEICEACIDKSYINCIINKCSENKLTQSTILAIDAYFRKYLIKPKTYINRFVFVSKFILSKHVEFDRDYQHKSTLIYNFIPNLQEFENCDIKGDYILYYGRLSKEKGITNLIEAAESCKIKLLIVGTGPLFNKENKTKSDYVLFLGYKSGNELWSLVKNASFIVVPSEWYENNPLTILEAYALGKPVIGARIGGIPEIIKDGETGYLFKSGDLESLKSILIKTEQITQINYKKMSDSARHFAEENFNPENHYNNLISTYNDVIKSYIYA